MTDDFNALEDTIDVCEGGTITVKWTVDDLCFNETKTATYTLTKNADPLEVSCPGDMESTEDTAEADFATWIAGFTFSGGCSPEASDLSGYTVPECGESVTINFSVDDLCANESCSATFSVKRCVGYCSYTQGFYGNEGGLGCAPELEELHNAQFMMTGAMNDVGGIYYFGNYDGGNGKYFELTLEDVTGDNAQIFKWLPGGGSPRALKDSDQQFNGKINNVLLSQTITMFFNMQLNENIDHWKLDNEFYTSESLGCGSDEGYAMTQTFYIDQAVIDYLGGTGVATVADLFELANLALGDGDIGDIKHSMISKALDEINQGFDECRIEREFADADGDGFDTTTDCDDLNPAINPDATEVCDGIDNDCDGLVDDDDDSIVGQSTWYADADSDGFGDDSSMMLACNQPEGYVANNTDCDDTDGAVHPGATEVCDGIDNDCDGLVDDDDDSIVGQSTWYADADSDGFGDDSSMMLACDQPEGYVADNTDCDDADGAVHPGATEVCDGIDNDCDGLIDDDDGDLVGGTTWYADTDGDGYGDDSSMMLACDQPEGYVADNTDCDDTDGAVHPGATEVCDGIDNDCDGEIDEGVNCEDLAKVSAKVTTYPVPIVDKLTVKYQIDYETDVRIDVFDAKGALIQTVIDENYSKGSQGYKVIDFYKKANQSYIIRLTTNREAISKMVVADNN